jgi:hypothetical protein
MAEETRGERLRGVRSGRAVLQITIHRRQCRIDGEGQARLEQVHFGLTQAKQAAQLVQPGTGTAR